MDACIESPEGMAQNLPLVWPVHNPTDCVVSALGGDDQQWCCTPRDPLREAVFLSTAPGLEAGFKCQPALKARGIP